MSFSDTPKWHLKHFIGVLACTILLVAAGSGCDNKAENPFAPIVIPPPSVILDTLYTETDTGLKFFDLQVGEGSLVEEGFVIQYHYILWRQDSTVITSSYLNGLASVILLDDNTGLIPGWREGLEGMRTGGFRQLLIPPALGFGSTGSQNLGIGPDETLYMELAIIGIGVEAN